MRNYEIAESGVMGDFPYVILDIEGFAAMDHSMNGYIGVPPSHPWFEKNYNDLDVEAHGGLTFAGRFDDDKYATKAGQPFTAGDIWWLGFDTMHYDDHDSSGRWRYSLDFMRGECENLARQCAESTQVPA